MPGWGFIILLMLLAGAVAAGVAVVMALVRSAKS